jgi:hypothetical protein
MNEKTEQVTGIPSQSGKPYGLVNYPISKWFATAAERDAYARSRRNFSKWEKVDLV